MDTKHIKIIDYQYDLPEERIAKFPLDRRDASKLLVYRKGEICEKRFYELPELLPRNSLMVFNNTKVIQARIYFRKETGALIEVFLLEPTAPADYEQVFQSRETCAWACMVGNLKKWKDEPLHREVLVGGMRVVLTASKEGVNGVGQLVRFNWDNAQVSFAEVVDAVGELPIPPYLNRETVESDKTTYQTVYSKIKGSVAAPTAGLHFTNEVLQHIDTNGILREEITLHVGAGTFKPVKSEEIAGHDMHNEFISVRKSTLENLLKHHCEVIAVGTTSVRTLESLYYIGAKLHNNIGSTSDIDLHVNQWEPYENDRNGDLITGISVETAIRNIIDYLDTHNLPALHTGTQIILAPGYSYKLVKAMITNFHQPQSTLLLLVSAFLKGDWKKVYDYALDHKFRFLSYGDSSLLIP